MNAHEVLERAEHLAYAVETLKNVHHRQDPRNWRRLMSACAAHASALSPDVAQ